MIEFKLDHKSGVPLYRQIIDQIRYGIASGKWKAGEQLPTVRALAVELKVNLNTVSKAYKELEILKILETQQGTGTFISDMPIEINEKERKGKLESICTEFLTAANSYGFTVEDIVEELGKREK
ncbi:GntR family transcriptional regulator [bacterium]|nr:GntR family transcriptional regulator [bacterium]